MLSLGMGKVLSRREGVGRRLGVANKEDEGWRSVAKGSASVGPASGCDLTGSPAETPLGYETKVWVASRLRLLVLNGSSCTPSPNGSLELPVGLV